MLEPENPKKLEKRLQALAAKYGNLNKHFDNARENTLNEKDPWDPFFKRVERTMQHAASEVLNNPEDVNDAIQEAKLKTIKNASTFRGESDIKTWLTKIARHEAIDIKRKLPKNHAPLNTPGIDENGEKTSPISEYIQDPTQDSAKQLKNKLFWNKLNEALEKLPENQRKTMILYHTQNKSYKDISKKLGLPIGTVKSNLHHARKTLKENMQNNNPENQ